MAAEAGRDLADIGVSRVVVSLESAGEDAVPPVLGAWAKVIGAIG